MKTISQKISVIATTVAMLAVAIPALAWTNPTTPPPNNGNTFAPVHTGGQLQVKSGDLGVDDLLSNTMHSGKCSGFGCLWIGAIFSAGDFEGTTPGVYKGLGVDPSGATYFFDGTPFPPNPNAPTASRILSVNPQGKVEAGAVSGLLPGGTPYQTLYRTTTQTWAPSSFLKNTGTNITIGGPALSTPYTNSMPLTVQTTGTGPAGADAVALVSNDPSGVATNIKTNKANFGVWSDANNNWADNHVRNLQIAGQNPAPAKVLASTNTSGDTTWVTVNVPVPDIQIVEEDWADQNDNWSGVVYCKNDYAAIAVSCTASGDGGADDCHLVNAQGGYMTSHQTGNDVGQAFNWGAYGNSDYKGGLVSPANDNANVHIWVTCMRYQNYPSIITLNQQQPQGQTWHYAGTPTTASASTCGAAYGTSNASVGVVKVVAYSTTGTGTPTFTQPALGLGTTVLPSQCAITGGSPYKASSSQLPSGHSWASQSSSPWHYVPADSTYEAERYYTVKLY